MFLFINNMIEKVLSIRHTLLNGEWAQVVLRFENPIIVLIVIFSVIGLWIYGIHNTPYADVKSGKVSKEELKHNRSMQVKGMLICGIGVILLAILGTACVKVQNM